MSILETFPSPPGEDLITICEWENQLIAQSVASTVTLYTDTVKDYPKVVFPSALITPQQSKESARDAFIEHDVSMWIKASCAYREHGFTGLLEELSCGDEQGSTWLVTISKVLISLLNLCWLPLSIFPYWQMPSEELITEFSSVPNWHNSPIKAFAWHPRATKFAIAFRDDSVRAHSIKSNIAPILKHKCQKGITDMAWMPYSSSILTVACKKCILVWQVDPESVMTRPPAGCVQVLEHPGHSPITSISWNKNGTLLISASPMDHRLRVWDISYDRSEAILRYSSGFSLVSWSPDCRYVFSATTNPMFKLWETQTWTNETWSKLAGHCKAVCWHPTSTVLLFATKNDFLIYGLNFIQPKEYSNPGTTGVETVTPVATVAPVTFETANGTVEIGGCVQSMDWDPHGERLAVTFEGSDKTRSIQKYIALFRTRIRPYLELSPCGFIRGRLNEVPQVVSFQKHCDIGSVLAVCWLNVMTGAGRVAFIPIHFLPSSTIQKSSLISSPSLVANDYSRYID